MHTTHTEVHGEEKVFLTKKKKAFKIQKVEHRVNLRCEAAPRRTVL